MKLAAEWKKELEIWTKISSSEFKAVNCACSHGRKTNLHISSKQSSK